MKNNLKKLLVLLLAANMFAGTTIPAFAEETEEPVVETEIVDNGDGTNTEITTTMTQETDEEGNMTVTVTIEETIDDTTGNVTEDGVTVNYDQTTVTTTTTDPEGKEIGSSTVIDGSETKKWTEEDKGDGEQEEVEVELIPGETTTGTVTTTETTGDTKDSEGEKDYDYTETTTTDRTVTVETSEVEVTVNDSNTGLVGDQEIKMEGLTPVYDENDDIKYRSDGRIDDNSGKDGLFDRNYLSASDTDPSKWTNIPPEGEYKYVGTGEHSKYWIAKVTVTYEKDPVTGETLFDENGNPIIKDITKKDGTNITINGEDATEFGDAELMNTYNGSRATNFMLLDKDGNRVFGYCCDIVTGTVTGKWYSVSNLEDSDYYASEESEEHIRSIAMNGYWGTSDIPKEDGTYETGSLEGIKAKLKDAVENGDIPAEHETYLYSVCSCSPKCTSKMPCQTGGKLQYDENGDPIRVKYNMLDLIDGMTEGEALCATQAAIWSYSNGHQDALSGKDGQVVVDAGGFFNFQGDDTENEPLNNEGNARVEFLYNWLIGLETEEESTVVINEKNFVEDVTLTVKDKVEDHENNLDENEDNDVYHSELNFKLAFIPGENDDLLVQITYTDLDGNEVNVVRRLAGENAEGQSYEDIRPEEDGSYVLKGLKLSENQNFNFDLRLEGTQYLEQGVYVYAPVGGRDVSQTFVGIAEGERNVDVSMGMTIKFDVDEDNHVVAERHWHEEIDPEIDPDDPTPDPEPEDPKPEPKKPEPKPEDPKPEPKKPEPKGKKYSFKVTIETEPEEIVEIEDEDIPLVDIPDEAIPLTDIPDEPIPQTGDSMFWYITGTLAALALSVLSLGKKGKKENA